MKLPVGWVFGGGAVAVFYAVILNLTTGATQDARITLAAQSLVCAIVAIGCGAFALSKGNSWKFFSIALIGPGLFVLADCGMRLVFLLTHH